MTHVLIISGSATGGPVPRDLFLTSVINPNVIGNVRLDYVSRRFLNLTRVDNVNTINALVLNHIVVRTLTLTNVANANVINALALNLIPFVADNAETTALLSHTTGTYSTTQKKHIDLFITALKTAGVWSKLDWFSVGSMMANEHDSYLDWTTPTRSLVNTGGITYANFVGWTGLPSINKQWLKSAWNVGDGPHSTSSSLTIFAAVESIVSAENGMTPAGQWRRTGSPAQPDGSVISLSILANTGFALANDLPSFGNTSFAVGSGVGLWATVHTGGTNKTIKAGVEVDSDAVTGVSVYTTADGISFVGSSGLAGRSFNGLVSYVGIGAALTAVELSALVSAYSHKDDPIDVVTDALLINGSGDYLLVDPSTYLKYQ